MKKIILFSAITIFSISGYSQQGKVPNYIKADNANLVVYIYPREPFITKSTGLYAMPSTTYKKISPEDYPTLDEALFHEISAIINEKLLKMGINPVAYLNYNPNDTKTDPNAFIESFSSVLQKKPYAHMYIIINEIDKIKKAYKKNKLSAAIISPVSLSIFNSGEVPEVYSIAKMNMSLEKGLDILSAQLSSKPKNYYLTHLDNIESQVNSEAFDNMAIMIKENNKFNSYPDDLPTSKLLFVSNPGTPNKMNQEMIAHLTKYYPYEHTVINDMKQIEEYINKGYNYMFIMKSEEFIKSKTRPDGAFSTTTNVRDAKYFFVIKNIKTLDLYLGNEAELMDSGNGYYPWAFKNTLKIMAKHYNWKVKD